MKSYMSPAPEIALRYGHGTVTVPLPPGADVYSAGHPEPTLPADELVMRAVAEPTGTPPLPEALDRRRPGEVVVVVSDVTRPIPYRSFLPRLLSTCERAGVARNDIVILVATGMHRASTPAERAGMFGPAIADSYRIVDHDADDEASLADLPAPSRSGVRVRLDRRYLAAGFRLVTGLVEPHFMAGFSGGRKTICPGLASLDTVRNFHGAAFLADPNARNGNLEENPLHLEALSVARLAPPDFTLNVVLDPAGRVCRAFAGALEPAHDAACDFVRSYACRTVRRQADVVLTSSGGHPLDATFYQCVKGFVSCLPAVKVDGTIIAVGACAEGVGGPEYRGIMERYSGRWREFLSRIREPGVLVRDQWQFQMHTRTLERVGESRIHFVTDGLPAEVLGRLSVSGHAVPAGGVEAATRRLLDDLLAPGASLAVFPEGPYYAPLEPSA